MTIDELNLSYKNGNYSQVIGELREKMNKEGLLPLEESTLFAKSIINAVGDFAVNEPMKNIVKSSIGIAYKSSNTLEELYKTKYEITVALYDFKRRLIDSLLEQLRSSYSKKVWDRIISIPADYSEFEFFDMELSSFSPMRNLWLKKEGDAAEEKARKLYEEVENDPCGLEMRMKIATVGQELFDQLVEFINEEGDAAVEAVQSIIDTVCNRMFIVSCMLGYTSEFDEDYKGNSEYVDFYIQCRVAYANLMKYQLECTLKPQGRPLSLYTNEITRIGILNDWRKCYDSILLVDPSYIVPPEPANIVYNNPPKSGCYVATCVYGSYDCPQVWTLRRYRDDTLAETWYGRAFIHTYYAISPTLVKWFGNTNWFKNLWKPQLDRMVKKLREEGVEDTPYEDKNW